MTSLPYDIASLLALPLFISAQAQLPTFRNAMRALRWPGYPAYVSTTQLIPATVVCAAALFLAYCGYKRSRLPPVWRRLVVAVLVLANGVPCGYFVLTTVTAWGVEVGK